MTPAELQDWMADVRAYALTHGSYNFGETECRWMLQYVRDPQLREQVRRTASFGWTCRLKLNLCWDLLDEVERGIAQAVADKLTQ